MKKIIIAVVTFAVIFLVSCELDVIEHTEPPIEREQSQVPFLGFEEIEPLFAGRYTIADWVADIPADDVEYRFFIEQATGNSRLDIDDNRTPLGLASFYIENNFFASVPYYGDNRWIYQTLPDEILALNVIEVLHLNFERMGIEWNIRGITYGSPREEVYFAFLDAGRDDGWLYTIDDVVPNALVDDPFDNNVFIGGFCSFGLPLARPRVIIYYHTMPNDEFGFNIYSVRTRIEFLLSGHDPYVENFIFWNLTHRN